MWQTKQTRILFGSDAQINSLLTFVLGPSFVWSTTDVCPQCLRRHFSFKLGSTFWKAKIQIRSGKTVHCLKCWKCGKWKMWLYSPWMSNNQMVHFISSYRTVLQHLPLEYMQLPQIDKYTSNCAHEIWVRWSKVAFISYVWFVKRIGSPVIRGKANKKEARRRVERFDRSIFALTRCSKKSSFVACYHVKLSKHLPHKKKLFTRPW